MRLTKFMSAAFPYLFFAMICGLVLESVMPPESFLYQYIEQAAMPVGMFAFIAGCWPIAFPTDADAEE